MKKLGTTIFATVIGLASWRSTSTGASARVVCNEEGDCWHVKTDYQYRPEFHVTVHPDDWRWKEGENYRWHEHEGRGYWHGGTWSDF